MKKAKKLLALTLGLSVLFATVSLTGCPQNPGDLPDDGNGTGSGTGNGSGTGDNGAGKEDGGDGTSEGGITIKEVKFDLSGAQALATYSKDGNRAASDRAGTNNKLELAKILEDGSMENVIQVEGDIEFPEIKYILKSPSAKKNQLYIVLANDVLTRSGWNIEYFDEKGNSLGIFKDGEWPESWWSSNSVYVEPERIMGSLICVYEDGTFADVIAQEDGVNKRLSSVSDSWYYSDNETNIEPVVFDKHGYAYYITREWKADGYEWDDSATNIIYRFNPTTGKSEQLTVAIPGYSYSKIQVSGDGQWIFVQGRKDSGMDSSGFIRAIPVSNPNNASNLMYSSNGWINTGDWLYDENTKSVYVTSGMDRKSGLLKFFKDENGDYTADSYKVYGYNNSNDSADRNDNWYKDGSLYDVMNSNSCSWKEEVLDAEGKFDPSKLMNMIVKQVNSSMPKKRYYKFALVKEIAADEGTTYEVVGNVALDHDCPTAEDYPDLGWTHYAKYRFESTSEFEEDIISEALEDSYLYNVNGDISWYDSLGNYHGWVENSVLGLPVAGTAHSWDWFYRLKDGYKYITVDDIDLRFDNPDFFKSTFTSDEYLKSMLKEVKGMKNEDLLNVLSKPSYLAYLQGTAWWGNDRYYGTESTKGWYYKHNLLADILYKKGTDTLLCDDEDYKYFEESTIKAGAFSSSEMYFLYEKISSASVPCWKAQFYDEDTNLDYSKILDYFYSFASVEEGEFEFRLDWLEDTEDEDLAELYTLEKNEAALKYIMEDEDNIAIFYKAFRDCRYMTTDNSCPDEWYEGRRDVYGIQWFVAHTCFVKGTDNSIIPQIIAAEKYFADKANNADSNTPNDAFNTSFTPSSSWDWQYVTNLVMFDGELWGVYGYTWSSDADSNKVFRLLDKDGNYSGYVSPEFKGLHIKNIKTCEKGFYFKNLFLNKDGTEAGYQDVRLFDISKDKVDNLFENVSNKAKRNVESYTLAGDELYACTSMGTTVDNFVVNTDTLDVEVLATGNKLSQILGFKL